MKHLNWVLPMIPASLAFLTSMLNRRNIQNLRVEVNHRLSELIAEHGKVERAEGKAEGVAEEKGKTT